MSKLLTLDGLDQAQLGHIVNGCGGVGIDVPDWIFYAACQQHDLDYWIGCAEADRKTADVLFYTNMKLAACKLSWYKRWFYNSMAYTYYRSVRLFAAKHFYLGPAKRTADDLAAEMGITLAPPPAADLPATTNPAVTEPPQADKPPETDHPGEQVVS
jgi:hypothetical protein